MTPQPRGTSSTRSTAVTPCRARLPTTSRLWMMEPSITQGRPEAAASPASSTARARRSRSRPTWPDAASLQSLPKAVDLRHQVLCDPLQLLRRGLPPGDLRIDGRSDDHRTGPEPVLLPGDVDRDQRGPVRVANSAAPLLPSTDSPSWTRVPSGNISSFWSSFSHLRASFTACTSAWPRST